MIRLINKEEIGGNAIFASVAADVVNARFNGFLFSLGEQLGVEFSAINEAARCVLADAGIRQEGR